MAKGLKPSIKIDVPNNQDSFTDMVEYEIMPDNLNDLEEQIYELMEKTSRCGWYVGKRLIVIHEAFMNDIGYKDFVKYVEDKLGIKSTTAKNLMFVAKNFELGQALDFGSKLYLLYPVDKSKHEQYLQICKDNDFSYRQFAEYIKHNELQALEGLKNLLSLATGYTVRGNTFSINLSKLGFQIDQEDYTKIIEEIQEILKRYSKKEE
jgi:hypothetical protein